MRILAIDPGTYQSGWCMYETEGAIIGAKGIYPNNEMFDLIAMLGERDVQLAIEMIGHYGSGMSAGKEVFHTCMWLGRIVQEWSHLWWDERSGLEPILLLRKTIVTQICGFANAKPTNLKQAIRDRYPATGGGKVPQVGIKSKPGPLYGVKEHVWDALAVAIALSEMSDALIAEKKIPLLLLPE